MIVADQSEVLAFLESLDATGPAGSRLETHISFVVLRGARAWKLKRAVRFPYLDFSTPERRLAACEIEVSLNRRTAPRLYRGVRRVTRGPDGALAFDGPGALVDAVVEMARFDQADLFDRMAQDDRLGDDTLTQLAGVIARFHRDAPRDDTRSGAQSLEAALASNERAFAQPDVASVFDAAQTRAFFEQARAHLARWRGTLDARAREGFVRRCHGDLHLGNICLFEGAPTPFDCLEFNEDLATIDTLYDLAFALMDIWRLGRARQANLVFNRYVDIAGDDASGGVLPLFMSVRAAVRAHVDAARAATTQDNGHLVARARAHLALALDCLKPDALRLVAIGGLSGSGKSTLANGLAPHVGAPPGARILSTDRIRKALAGVDAVERLPPSAYTKAQTDRVYQTQRIAAARVLRGGQSALCEGVFQQRDERVAMAAVADPAGARFTGLWLRADRSTLVDRVERRRNDPSDATVDVLLQQIARETSRPHESGWRQLDANENAAAVTATALTALRD